jgi:hypothetical protein
VRSYFVRIGHSIHNVAYQSVLSCLTRFHVLVGGIHFLDDGFGVVRTNRFMLILSCLLETEYY